MSIISVKSLTKKFQILQRKKGPLGSIASIFSRDYVVKTTLDCVSFDINEGELVAYIGPNGAGKSQPIKILSGILVPTGG